MKAHALSSSKQDVHGRSWGLHLPCPTALSEEDPGPKAQQPEKLSKTSISQLTAPMCFFIQTKLGCMQQNWVCAFSGAVNIRSTPSFRSSWNWVPFLYERGNHWHSSCKTREASLNLPVIFKIQQQAAILTHSQWQKGIKRLKWHRKETTAPPALLTTTSSQLLQGTVHAPWLGKVINPALR